MKVEDLINKSDFKSFEASVSLVNNSSDTKITEKGYFIEFKLVTPASELKSIQLLEIHEDHLVISSPVKICAEGHHLDVGIRVYDHDASEKITLKTTVIEVEVTPEKELRVKLKVSNPDNPMWKRLSEKFSERQREIIEFFKAAKGF
jgi:hypothetical protein